MLSVTSPARELWWLWVESNHQPRAYETLALFHLSYTAVFEGAQASYLRFAAILAALF